MDVKTTIWQYCNYQERSHRNVQDKLYQLGCNASEVGQLIADLIENDLLNEERFARSFARGKFRLKHWGRKKIVQQLRYHNISDYCIRKAISEIEDAEYFASLKKRAERKLDELSKERNHIAQKAKLYRYLLQKGYETDIISSVYEEITSCDGCC